MRDKRTPKDVCGESTTVVLFFNSFEWFPSSSCHELSSPRLRNLIICYNLCVILFLARYSIRHFIHIPDRLGWSRTNLVNRERFFLSDASQVSAMVGDHSRQMKTQICTVGDRSMMDFTHYQSSKLLGDYSIYWQNLGLSVKAKNRGTQGRFFPK